MDNQRFYRFHANLQSAVIEAARVCVAWRRPEEDTKFNVFQMEHLAREYDAENPCEEGCSYEVSVEGAIGYCPGAQYLTRWLFYPAMDEKSLLEFVEDVQKKMNEIKAEEAPVARFCPNCGQPYPDDETRFCPNCGTLRQ